MKRMFMGPRWLGLGLVLSLVGGAAAQEGLKAAPDYSRVNTWTMFAEYSNTSSHIVMGASRQRIFADFGFGYTRRVFHFRNSSLGYHVEVRPVTFESDPLQFEYYTEAFSNGGFYSGSTVASISQLCKPSYSTDTFTTQPPPGQPSVTVTETATITCGRQWTFAQEFAPIGFQYSMRTRHPVQPFVVGTLGYMYSSRPIPLADAESLNFVWNFGAGVELYRSGTRSVSAECRLQHFSNRDTAPANPGVDNIMYKVSYSFGR